MKRELAQNAAKYEQDRKEKMQKHLLAKGRKQSVMQNSGMTADEVKSLQKKLQAIEDEKAMSSEEMKALKEEMARERRERKEYEEELLRKAEKTRLAEERERRRLEHEMEEREDKLKAAQAEEAAKGNKEAQEAQRMKEELEAMREMMKKKDEELQKEQRARRKIHNELEESKGNIRVICRVRPMNSREEELGCEFMPAFPDGGREAGHVIELATKSFEFDKAFPPDTSQETVFEDTKRLVQSTIDGFNVCIFAYGQTGSGKTWTMWGSEEGSKYGVTLRAIHELFNLVDEEESRGTKIEIRLSMMQLYLDKLQDLLGDPGANLRIGRKDGLVHVEGRRWS